MSELEEFDETKNDEDEYETPSRLYCELIKKYGIKPLGDACATEDNRKCIDYFSKKLDGLTHDWIVDMWCNPPHSKTEEFAKKAFREWNKHNINILMIAPANAICAKFFTPIFAYGAEYYRIEGRPRFLQHGKPAPNSSRNAYFTVIMRKKWKGACGCE